MVFSSAVFMFAYLPLVLIGYYALPKKYQLYYLFVLNLVFYGWGEPVFVLLMVLSIALNYLGALLMDKFPGKKKLWLIITVFVNLGLLGYFKYTGFFMETAASLVPALQNISIPNIVLPIGISFYTFQSMSYVIDVYRGDVACQKNPVVFGTYVALFPQLIAGPIVRYRDVELQMLGDREISAQKLYQGCKRFIIGLSKKLLLANAMGLMWTNLSQNPGANGVIGSWAGIIAYTFQIYFDFSGYSDMAIGLGKVMGFEFLENFNYPYIADSITDFWRRWHISLSTWFREYVYIPLGGNRRGIKRQLINLCVVWALTGLWHGASWNFVLWGVYFAVLLIIEKVFLLKALKKLPKFASHLYALLFIVLGWVLFYFTDFAQLICFAKTLIGVGTAGLIGVDAVRMVLGYLPMMLICAAASTPVVSSVWGKIRISNRLRITAETIALLVLFVLCAGAVIGQSYNPFIYFRF
ncbi:MAG: MBOAT family protein [Clostridia bacterium]|nr:MBOAT family protein [Clostridia bacterium]